MIIYNVTIKVAWPIQEAWLQWMQEVHMPEVLATGCFYKSQLVKLLEVDEEDGPTYAAQYYAASRNDYDVYIEHHSPAIRQKSMDKWGDLFIAFRSVMEIVN
ncbi:MAG: DUF4286 family protein [Candidatus Pseudobacter hemicellulosilyticus]|uniref:DUF4286 family protein n=1 Tax=Candidatus Pseudobacter hemicellulosilyticus TaxID=3121375 RepID=A0AAJ5WX57_9BACT|nr:MAG: DUF4286 family protein [Pseudobacter sp.]